MGQAETKTENSKNLPVNRPQANNPNDAKIVIKQQIYSVEPTKNCGCSSETQLKPSVDNTKKAQTTSCKEGDFHAKINHSHAPMSSQESDVNINQVRRQDVPRNVQPTLRTSTAPIYPEINPTPRESIPIHQFYDSTRLNLKKKKESAEVPIAATESQRSSSVPIMEQTQTASKSNQNLKGETKQSTPIHKSDRQKTKDFTNHRLFIGGLPEEITETELKTVFENYGKVTDVMIAFDKETNKSKRFGFVGFEDENSAKTCLELRFIIIKGKRVELKQSWPQKGSREKEKDNKNNDKSRKIFNKGTIPDSAAASSTDMENSLLDYQKLFNDYFKAKFAVQNLLGSEKHSDVRTSKEKLIEELGNKNELENLLKHLSISLKEKSTEGDSCSDSDETDSETDEDTCSANDASTKKSEKDETDFQTPDRLICNVCNWAPLDNSIENFLTHCNSFEHKLKLMERFQDRPQKTSTENNKNCHNCKSSQQTKRTRRRNKSRSRMPKGENEKRSKSVERKTATKGSRLTCEICKGSINFSQDPLVLMRNLEQHLKGRKHLNNLSQTPKDKKETLADAKEKEKNISDVKKSQTKPEVKFAESINDRLKSCKTISFDQLNSTLEKKVTFLCLPCNFFSSKQKTFLTHLYCESHLTTLKNKWLPNLNVDGVSIESLCKILIVCQTCGRYLFGSTSDIRRHFTYCNY